MAFRYEGVNWEDRPWRTVAAITTLGQQIEQIRPGRYPVDGTVSSRLHDFNNPRSDHRPDTDGLVHATIDFGGDPDFIAETVEAMRVSRDPRIKYVIYSRRMYSSYPKFGHDPYEWRPYSGSNPHATHAHVSVVSGTLAEDPRPWQITEDEVPQFTPKEEAAIRALLEHEDNLVGLGRGLDSKESTGWGLATQGTDLIRKERGEDNPLRLENLRRDIDNFGVGDWLPKDVRISEIPEQP